MRKNIALLVIALLFTAGMTLEGARKRSSSSSKGGTKAGSTAKKGSATAKKRSGKSKKGSISSTKKKRSGRNSATSGSTWRSRQLAPEPERYREIQQALIDKGYLQGPASGQWNQESADALRRFQREQNLEPNGKINSLSIIALGLGPKYDTASSAPVQLTPQQP
ncbi:MAG TPA: peptidoglycan-binding domain-containing protein [Bryobacteraceae bacterium]|nr:peptidoglycan-binding domain-containing protein [Bryobacteraceae bacterium]